MRETLEVQDFIQDLKSGSHLCCLCRASAGRGCGYLSHQPTAFLFGSNSVGWGLITNPSLVSYTFEERPDDDHWGRQRPV
ncbi:MAG: hypothetical protein R2788_19900 [Saprospiraceae bacterium]